MRLRAVIIVLLGCAIGCATAIAVGRTVLSKTRTFKLAAGKTATFEVAYPDGSSSAQPNTGERFRSSALPWPTAPSRRWRRSTS
jgi:hypothetical protein